MSSLPLISHHLFVAAIAPEDHKRRRSGPPEAAADSEPRSDQAITMEILDSSPPPRARGARAETSVR
jgi:hypothetical protein